METIFIVSCVIIFGFSLIASFFEDWKNYYELWEGFLIKVDEQRCLEKTKN